MLCYIEEKQNFLTMPGGDSLWGNCTSDDMRLTRMQLIQLSWIPKNHFKSPGGDFACSSV